MKNPFAIPLTIPFTHHNGIRGGYSNTSFNIPFNAVMNDDVKESIMLIVNSLTMYTIPKNFIPRTQEMHNMVQTALEHFSRRDSTIPLTMLGQGGTRVAVSGDNIGTILVVKSPLVINGHRRMFAVMKSLEKYSQTKDSGVMPLRKFNVEVINDAPVYVYWMVDKLLPIIDYDPTLTIAASRRLYEFISSTTHAFTTIKFSYRKLMQNDNGDYMFTITIFDSRRPLTENNVCNRREFTPEDIKVSLADRLDTVLQGHETVSLILLMIAHTYCEVIDGYYSREHIMHNYDSSLMMSALWARLFVYKVLHNEMNDNEVLFTKTLYDELTGMTSTQLDDVFSFNTH